MKDAQKLVADWMGQFGQEVPSTPTIPSLEVRKPSFFITLTAIFQNAADWTLYESWSGGWFVWNSKTLRQMDFAAGNFSEAVDEF